MKHTNEFNASSAKDEYNLAQSALNREWYDRKKDEKKQKQKRNLAQRAGQLTAGAVATVAVVASVAAAAICPICNTRNCEYWGTDYGDNIAGEFVRDENLEAISHVEPTDVNAYLTYGTGRLDKDLDLFDSYRIITKDGQSLYIGFNGDTGYNDYSLGKEIYGKQYYYSSSGSGDIPSADYCTQPIHISHWNYYHTTRWSNESDICYYSYVEVIYMPDGGVPSEETFREDYQEGINPYQMAYHQMWQAEGFDNIWIVAGSEISAKHLAALQKKPQIVLRPYTTHQYGLGATMMIQEELGRLILTSADIYCNLWVYHLYNGEHYAIGHEYNYYDYRFCGYNSPTISFLNVDFHDVAAKFQSLYRNASRHGHKGFYTMVQFAPVTINNIRYDVFTEYYESEDGSGYQYGESYFVPTQEKGCVIELWVHIREDAKAGDSLYDVCDSDTRWVDTLSTISLRGNRTYAAGQTEPLT